MNLQRWKNYLKYTKLFQTKFGFNAEKSTPSYIQPKIYINHTTVAFFCCVIFQRSECYEYKFENSKTLKMLLYLSRKPIGCKILAALPKLANLHRCAQACPSFLYSRLSGQDILLLNSLSRNIPIFKALTNSGFDPKTPN